MPYDISQFSPAYGGTINSSGNVVNVADLIDETTGLMKPGSMKAMTFQTGATAVGNGTPQDITGYATISIDVVISGTATVNFEVSNDGTNYNGINCSFSSTGSATVSNTTSTIRAIRFNVAGFKYFRARISSYTSGTVDVSGFASIITSAQLFPINSYGNSDSNSAAGAIPASAAYNLLYDGTNWVRHRAAYNVGDTQTGTGTAAVGLNGYSGASWDRVRVGKVYKWNEFLGLTAGSTFTVWTPTSTKKIRIMGMSVSVSGAAALNVRVGTAGSGTRIATLRFAGAGNYYMDFGNGYLATNATQDVLEINNPSASPTGTTVDVHVTVWGTEE